MSRAEGSLSITLKSDLCSGSGDGFSSGIDIDVCYDEQGLPIVLGRRIKGCLREAAELVGCEHVSEIFGRTKDGVSGSMRVSNAVVRDSQRTIVLNDVQQTLSNYTSIRALTAIDELTGSARSNTLRFVRVVRHYVSKSDSFEELELLAPISVDEVYKDELGLAAKALRNMGMGRNRGLGAVKCNIAWESIHEGHALGHKFQGARFDEAGQEMVAISYTATLEAPVMLPRDNSTRTVDWISGTSVRGCFAGVLKENDSFDDVILSDKVRFSPLYPYDKDRGWRALPAPSFVVKIKGGMHDGEYANVFDFVLGEGESVKPLRDGFVGSDWRPIPVSTETIYHHSRQGEGALYTQRCLSAGQTFAGFIECPVVLADVVRSVLALGELSFGRSKSAQYALCSVEESPVDFSGHDDPCVELCAGEAYAIVLDSDVLLLDERSRFTTSFQELRKALVDAWSPWLECARMDVDEPGDSRPIVTSVRSCTVSGYNAKWNQKKPHVRVFSAGSTLVFTMPKGFGGAKASAVTYVGERRSEGFGRAALVRLKDVVVTNAEGPHDVQEQYVSDIERARLGAVACADQGSWRGKQLTSSFVGRLALMVRESQDEDDLANRIASIKNEQKRGLAEEAIGLIKGLLPDGYGWQLLQECLMLFLGMVKYAKKQEGKEVDR